MIEKEYGEAKVTKLKGSTITRWPSFTRIRQSVATVSTQVGDKLHMARKA
jgi:hypothetical protein